MAITPFDPPYPKNPMLHANITVLCLIERKLLPIKVLHCGNRHFQPFWLLWPWPWPDNLHIWTWPVVRGDILHVQIWTSNARHTDRQDHQNYTPCHFSGGQQKLQFLKNYPTFYQKIFHHYCSYSVLITQFLSMETARTKYKVHYMDVAETYYDTIFLYIYFEW